MPARGRVKVLGGHDRFYCVDPDTAVGCLPVSIEVREIHVRVDQPGFRTDSFVVVTTLKDGAVYPNDDIAELHHNRWLAELDVRAIDDTLGMDILRCMTPEMVRKEMRTCHSVQCPNRAH